MPGAIYSAGLVLLIIAIVLMALDKVVYVQGETPGWYLSCVLVLALAAAALLSVTAHFVPA